MRFNQRGAPFAKKSFGQNFLTDRHFVAKIIGAVDPRPGAAVVEIGPGRGALTEHLVASGADVAAIEIERDMIALLRERFAGAPNFRLIEDDALKVDFAALTGGRPARLVANLPYYISTAILQKLIAERRVFERLILMFQREVVERITAPPDSSERGFLTVMTEAFLDARKLFDVPPQAFRPAPKVWSAIVELTPKKRVEIGDESFFRELVSAAFRQKRKTLLNNLKILPPPAGDWAGLLHEAGLDPQRRAESLTIGEWTRLVTAATAKKIG